MIYPAHPLADMFPMIPEAERKLLADDIVTFGQRDPIILLDGMVLDGRNRQWACGFAEVEPIYEQYAGDDPLNFVLSKNLHRRHLTESQRALIAAKITTWKLGDNQHSSGRANLPIWKAAGKFSISARSVAMAKGVIGLGVPELIAAVSDGQIRLHKAVKISKLDSRTQKKTVRDEVVGHKPARRQANIRLSSGRILRDIPWSDLLPLADSLERDALLLRTIAGHVANADHGSTVGLTLSDKQIVSLSQAVCGGGR